VIKKAYDVLAFIGRGIEYKSWEIMLSLYIKPWLGRVWKYREQFWSPHYQKDVEALERECKEGSPRCCPCLEGVGYEERLNKLGLFSLERRRLRGRPNRGRQNDERHRRGG